MAARRRPPSVAARANELLSSDEASEFGALKDTLPAGWVVELQPDPGLAWVAVVYQADAPRTRPMFTVCRWRDRAGLFMEWWDGHASSATAFTELWPTLEQIPGTIFAAAQAEMTTVQSPGWTRRQH